MSRRLAALSLVVLGFAAAGCAQCPAARAGRSAGGVAPCPAGMCLVSR